MILFVVEIAELAIDSMPLIKRLAADLPMFPTNAGSTSNVALMPSIVPTTYAPILLNVSPK